MIKIHIFMVIEQCLRLLRNPKILAKNIYNIWLRWLGLYLAIVAFKLFDQTKYSSLFLAILILLSVLSFVVGVAIVFMSLLFIPLLASIMAFRFNNYLLCIIYAIDFIIALIFFSLFIMADKDKFKGTIISYEGFWQRCSLLAMYFPFIYMSITQIL